MDIHALGVQALRVDVDRDGLAGLLAREHVGRVPVLFPELVDVDGRFARGRAVDPRLDDGDVVVLHLAECRRHVAIEGLERGHERDRGISSRPRAAGVDCHEDRRLALVEEHVLAWQDADGIQPDGLAHGLRLYIRRPGLGPHEPDLTCEHAHEISKRVAEEPRCATTALPAGAHHHAAGVSPRVRKIDYCRHATSNFLATRGIFHHVPARMPARDVLVQVRGIRVLVIGVRALIDLVIDVLDRRDVGSAGLAEICPVLRRRGGDRRVFRDCHS